MNEAILIVDDESDIREVLSEALKYEPENYRVTAVESGEEAVGLLLERSFDVLVVDMRLEGSVSGAEVIKKCGAMRKQPKIFAASATPREVLIPVLEKEGISGMICGVLEKPSDLNPDIFVGIVKNTLKR